MELVAVQHLRPAEGRMIFCAHKAASSQRASSASTTTNSSPPCG